MAKLTVAEALRQLNDLEYRQAVWMEVTNFLSKFVEDEVSQPEGAIATDSGVRVPQEVVQELIDEINGSTLEPLEKSIDEIKGRPVQEKGNVEKKSGPRLVKAAEAESEDESSPQRSSKRRRQAAGRS